MLLSILQENFVTLVLCVCLATILASGKHSRDARLPFLWLTLGCVLGLCLADSLEKIAAQDPELRFWRLFFSVIGYVLRPTAGLGALLVLADSKQRNFYLAIPAIVSGLVMSTAFFSPLTFGFDEEYAFFRGPLGYTVFVAAYFYIAAILWITHKRFREGRAGEGLIMYVCGFSCIAASCIEATAGGNLLNSTILIGCLFYYMFIRSQDTDRDGLTKLLNRQSFYEDCETYKNAYRALASLDMNGLKVLNDTQGHEAGDLALEAIGSIMLQSARRSVIPYRVGGDEFIILFLRQFKDPVEPFMRKLQQQIADAGYSVSVGWAERDGEDSIDRLLRESDRLMYEEKSRHYQERRFDRRKR